MRDGTATTGVDTCLIGTYDAGTHIQSFYINKALAEVSGDLGAQTFSNAGTLLVGYDLSTLHYANVTINETGLFDRAFSGAEVTDVCDNGLRGVSTIPVLRLNAGSIKFNAGSFKL